ncbi:Importin-beta, N-terminal domain [Lasallia pustulata]|uniref:Importin-beta, N-terminal domain n=1 Tax=Lasallia pustulata TaxID=136370 RepID=A0A1W5D726_9LECA|nr:Importin-beta, N-terminal domain [Lasallia pustulata]
MAAHASVQSDVHLQVGSIEEVGKLVQRLYSPGTPREIGLVQDTLQKLQRSQDGWQIADALLQSPNDKVRFFGALTFTIKINQDWASVDAASAILLLQRLLSWLVRLVAKGDAVAYDVLDHYPTTNEMIAGMSRSQLLTTIWLITTLVEEVGKVDSNSVQTHKYHERVAPNLEDTVVLLSRSLDLRVTGDEELALESVGSFQSWVMYAHRAWMDNSMSLEPLRVLTPQLVQVLTTDGMIEATAECFADILCHFPAYFTQDDFASLAAILSGSFTQERVAALKALSSVPEDMALARLLFAYGDATVQDLTKDIGESTSKQILQFLLDLMGVEGIVVAEDEICSQALEFWMTYTEFLIDSLFAAGEGKPPWMDTARQYVVNALEAAWLKIRMPPVEVTATWDSEIRAGFKAFRADVEDLLQSSYTLLGIGIFQQFANSAFESLKHHAWGELEATLFCLNALSDSIGDEESADEVLITLFGSSLFTDMTSATAIPLKTRQTAVSLLEHYTDFFERHTELLPAALNFLFDSLKITALTTLTARAIHSLCSSCRKSLVPELGAFLQQYEILLSWTIVEGSTKEKVMGAIAAIIQAMPSEESKIAPLDRLLRFVESDIRSCIDFMTAGQVEDSQMQGFGALRCLAAMGKALQTPDDVAIDLEDEVPHKTAWEHELGFQLQSRLIRCFKVVTDSFKWSGEIIEAGSHVLRTGYTETSPGPFVFPPQVTEEFVARSDLRTARLSTILDTAGAMLSRHASDASTRIDSSALVFLAHVLELIGLLEVNPTNEPEVASSCVDLADKLMPRYLNIFLDPQVQRSMRNLFIFALRCLTAAEILPKRSAADFWTSFVQIRGQADHIQRMVDGVMIEYGPLLSQALMRNIGGQAARSELDVVAEPLKKMVFKQPGSKAWLDEALFSDTFPSQSVGPEEKRIWLQKVMKLRGAKGTNQVIRDFWIACRGTSLSYAS